MDFKKEKKKDRKKYHRKQSKERYIFKKETEKCKNTNWKAHDTRIL